MSSEKKCVVCGEIKPRNKFASAKGNDDGLNDLCRSCVLGSDGYRRQRRPADPVSGVTKTCRLCASEKPIEEFYKARGTRDGRRGECGDCFQLQAYERKQKDPTRKKAAQVRTNQWRADNPERDAENRRRKIESGSYKRSLRKTHLKMNYGLTLEDYDRMLEEQGGVCSICGDPPRDDIALHVDHCHDTGRIRGLLCFKCNAGLGQFRHNVVNLRRATAYLDAEPLGSGTLGQPGEQEESDDRAAAHTADGIDPDARARVKARLAELVAARPRADH